MSEAQHEQFAPAVRLAQELVETLFANPADAQALRAELEAQAIFDEFNVERLRPQPRPRYTTDGGGALSRLLKESWMLVEEHEERVASYFYARLFLSHPHLRDLFPVQLDVQRSRLLQSVLTAAQIVDDADRFDEYFRSLGRAHRKFGVRPEHYELVGHALVEAMRCIAGPEWAVEFDRAWTDVLAMMTAKMMAGAKADETNLAFHDAEVIRHERRTSDIAVFTVRPVRPLTFRAGQYVSLEYPRVRPRLWRTYSPANAPRPDNSLDFHVRAIGAGWVSSALVRQLEVGDTLRLAAPMGAMTLDRRSTRDVVFIAGGTGLAPVKALIEELTRYNRTRWIHVFLGARTREDLYDLDALTHLAAHYPWLSVVTACSADPTFPGERGDISDVVARYGPWNEHDFYVSGSPQMIRATLRTLAELQVPAIRVKYDVVSDGIR